jgi:hypothetical protein
MFFNKTIFYKNFIKVLFSTRFILPITVKTIFFVKLCYLERCSLINFFHLTHL